VYKRQLLIGAPRQHETFITHVIEHPQAEPSYNDNVQSTSLVLRFKNFIRRHLFIPDGDIRWALRTVAALKSEIGAFDVILTTSPPESIHVAGYKLAVNAGVPWIADVRDFWFQDSLVDVRRLPFRKWIEKCLVKIWLSKASLCLAVSPSIASEIQGLTSTRVVTLPQMTFSPADISPSILTLDKARIHVAHTGSFSLSDPNRTIDLCLEVFSRALGQNPDLHLHLIGRLTSEEKAMISEHEIRENLTVHGTLDYTTTLGIQLQMNALLAYSAPDSQVITGKFFEYLNTGRQVICMGGAVLLKANRQTESAEKLLAALTGDETSKEPVEPQGYSIDEAGQDLVKLLGTLCIA